MFRFDRLIRTSMTVGDIKLEYPQTIPIFERYGFATVCDDCPLEVVARRQGISPLNVVDELNRFLFANPVDENM